MAVSQQVLHLMKVKFLKNLKDLEISFEGSSVTAILGPNGNGKSTILHALACSFSPNEFGEDYKFSWFFLPSTDALWNDSELSIIHSFRDAQVVHQSVPREYKKTQVRWTPRYANRPKRDVFYIGIDKCVPMIESEKKQAKINYSTKEVNEDIINIILEKASVVLNRNYSGYNVHTASGKEFIGVVVDGLRYSALSMSAGEQKVFYILEKIFRANKYSLILIDELDLLLHDQAMKKLVDVILERSNEKKLQVIFTTHRESILELEDRINIRHIVCRPNKTLCFNETKPDAINRLTGVQPTPIEVFVEDDLAATIVKKVAAKLRIAKYTSVRRYGAATNCFTTVGGLLLGGETCDNSLFVLDGDVYRTPEEKVTAVNRVLTGHDQNVLQAKSIAISIIKQFILPDAVPPEKHLHSLLINMVETDNDEFNEIIEVATEIIAVDNEHKFINDIIHRLGWERAIGLSKIVDLAATSGDWDNYVSEVFAWLSSKKDNMREELAVA
ncbi:AAA family ATPase [Vreelandella profundi]|uniref:AAA family ATPase n=1 Tax=Vreelandella profundi TaxID=2852117 RepID=UPI001EF0BD2C|nr:AAA family ATPase [Halomonas profundi]